MKPLGVALLFAVLLNIVLVCPVRAQFSTPPPTPQANDSGKESSKEGNKENKNTYFGGIGLYPATVFDAGGRFAGNNGTTSLYGGLISLDGGVINGDGTRYSIGGWYWGRSGEDLYEVHARIQSRSNLGFQFGYLNTTQGFIPRPQRQGAQSGDAEAYDVFFIYSVTGKRHAVPAGTGTQRVPENRAGSTIFNNNWSIEFGLGTYIDASLHYINNNLTPSNNATANYTFYVAGGYQFAPHWWIQGSEWLLRIRSQDLNRLALGVAFTF